MSKPWVDALDRGPAPSTKTYWCLACARRFTGVLEAGPSPRVVRESPGRRPVGFVFGEVDAYCPPCYGWRRSTPVGTVAELVARGFAVPQNRRST